MQSDRADFAPGCLHQANRPIRKNAITIATDRRIPTSKFAEIINAGNETHVTLSKSKDQIKRKRNMADFQLI